MTLNVYAVIILGSLLAEFGLNLAAGLLNLRCLSGELPAEFAGVYDAESYRRSQEYTRASTRMSLASSGAQLAITLAFWLAGGFEALDELMRSAGLGPIAAGLAYFGVLVLAQALFGLPFGLYDTFVIEERFGFNRTTPATFAADRAKGLALAAGLGGPLTAAVLFLFGRFGPPAWLIVWAVVIVFSLAVQFAAPRWIMPLFLKFTPLPDGELSSALLAYARRVRFPVAGVYVVDGSRRSSRANAFFTGYGATRRVALFDTLIDRYSAPELVAVLAHEVGHFRLGHIWKGTLAGLAHAGVLLFLASRFLENPGLLAAFGVSRPSVYVSLVLFGLLYTPIEMALALGLQSLSRRNEYAADRFALATTGDAEAEIAALKKLAAENLAQLAPHPLEVALHYSHPPDLERVAALRCAPRPPAAA